MNVSTVIPNYGPITLRNDGVPFEGSLASEKATKSSPPTGYCELEQSCLLQKWSVPHYVVDQHTLGDFEPFDSV
jgi:hypothetical protein